MTERLNNKVQLATVLLGSLIVLGLLLLQTSSLAGDNAKEDSGNWSEKAIDQHIDQSTLEGELTKAELSELSRQGEKLFQAKFTTLDGVGRPKATSAIIPTKSRRAAKDLFNRIAGPDASACSSCHIEPLVGGAGDVTMNVFASEGFTGQGTDSTNPQFSNERNTNHIFGAGLIELLAREMTAELQQLRKKVLAQARSSGKSATLELTAKGVNFGTLSASPDGLVDLTGIKGIDTDLVIRPFSQKGVMTSLRQFTINALNAHHGMQATERFGLRWTGEKDFDEDGHSNEITEGDVSALVAFQATLAPPLILAPQNSRWKDAAEKGKNLFSDLACIECHKPFLPLNSLKFADPGPVDAAGTLRQSDTDFQAIYNLALTGWAAKLPRNDKGQVLVPLFGDLKRHVISDNEVNILGNELLSQRFVARNEFITAELWGVASTMPYGHRGDLTTLHEVIAAHGGEARKSREDYLALSDNQRSNLIAYLKTMVIDQ